MFSYPKTKKGCVQQCLVLARFIRRGRASKPRTAVDLDDDARDVEFEEISSDIENTDELQEWLSTKPTGHMTHILPQQTLVRKFLPPGTVSDLYEHYKSTQQMLGGYFASFLDYDGTIFCEEMIIHDYLHMLLVE